jgi:hypothetical protein
MTLNNAMSTTPCSPDPKAREKVRTWVKSQRKLMGDPGQFSAEINRLLAPVTVYLLTIHPRTVLLAQTKRINPPVDGLYTTRQYHIGVAPMGGFVAAFNSKFAPFVAIWFQSTESF